MVVLRTACDHKPALQIRPMQYTGTEKGVTERSAEEDVAIEDDKTRCLRKLLQTWGHRIGECTAKHKAGEGNCRKRISTAI